MPTEISNTTRYDVIKLLKSQTGNVGVELGVAEGGFSAKMVASGVFSSFFGVDRYSDVYGVEEYKTALRTVGLETNYKLLRMSFDEAYDLFDGESLDFIYVDGYAHSGEEGGETIYQWSRKVKVGGVIAGDDYHDDWPLVKEAVEAFVRDTGFELKVTTNVDPNSSYAKYPSWAVIKEKPTSLSAPEALVRKAKSHARRVDLRRKATRRLKVFVERTLGTAAVKKMKSVHDRLFARPAR